MKDIIWKLIILIVFTTGLCQSQSRYSNRYPPNFLDKSCVKSACFPATGNLLIGRTEKNLTATSTCGLYGEETFCMVSHLSQDKCKTCDSRNPNSPKSHRIQNVVHNRSDDYFWKSENGVQYVSIRLNLDAKFHFTHLIMIFKTFRPKAMIVERSADDGKTWKDYGYFAENCTAAFPHIKLSPPSTFWEISCDQQYSSVEPSQNGEVIFRVIQPNLQGRLNADYYSEKMLELMTITNLRINFTELHTLGDDIVGESVKSKYYYAIKEMTVRGSCLCYGHAQSCLPTSENLNLHETAMVHGRCNCTHNTEGLNCEKCKKTHNDLPWSAAYGSQTFTCQPCNCNKHATTCEFNEEVFRKSGYVSGGICNNCTDNTRGVNCEKCIDNYYLHSSRHISDPDACIPCECNKIGTTDDGLCDPVTDFAKGWTAGRCHCKTNVVGLHCDQCKPNFWNFTSSNIDGCQACTCDPRGIDTSLNDPCDPYNGECKCKPNVIGRDCNQCKPQYWGLSESTRQCEQCNCDIGGSLSFDCDIFNGSCRCLPNIEGRTCNITKQGFYVRTPEILYEGEYAHCARGSCQVELREPPRNESQASWTGPGFMKVHDNAELEFTLHDIPESIDYNIIVRYEGKIRKDNVRVIIERNELIDSADACANYNQNNDAVNIELYPHERYKQAQTVCLEKNKTYKLIIQLLPTDYSPIDYPSASILIDSIVLVPDESNIHFFTNSPVNIWKHEIYLNNRCDKELFSPIKSGNELCKKYHFSIGSNIFREGIECDCDPIGSKSLFCDQIGGQCECQPNVIGRRCDKCAPGKKNFGREGCTDCDCNSVGSQHNFCNVTTGQCKCINNTYGLFCDDCNPGWYGFPHCTPCECNGHAITCDRNSGWCINCQDHTTGPNCDRCEDGYYGDPRLSLGAPCKSCQCPGTAESGNSFADRCVLDPITDSVRCECKPGYTGARCDRCADNYYGNPDEPGGSCNPCECNDNIIPSRHGNCDTKTGKCLLCDYFTTGDHCEVCKPDYFGDAIKKTCRECRCEFLGTNSSAGFCNSTTGQCNCYPNVTGISCNSCIENHWKIASATGCEPCECDATGSRSESCHLYNGKCDCKEGFGGDQCNKCELTFWGDPKTKCHHCNCNLEGSINDECDQESGICTCQDGIGGDKCDRCKRGWLGNYLKNCTRCDECFYNWDSIIKEVSVDTDNTIRKAKQIKQTGATGAYNSEFDAISKMLEEIESSLTNSRTNTAELDKINNEIEEFRSQLSKSGNNTDSLSHQVQDILSKIFGYNYTLNSINEKTSILEQEAKSLKNDETQLKEKDLKGALNLTRDAGESSKKIDAIVKDIKNLLNNAERQCKRAEQYINDTTELDNEYKKQNLEFKASQINSSIPTLNNKVCSGTGIPCDSLCGGAGCDKCGGISCESGAVGKAEAGLKIANTTEKDVESKIQDAERIFRSISQAKLETENATQQIKDAFNLAENLKHKFKPLIKESENITDVIELHRKENKTNLSEIKEMAQNALLLNIPLKPEEIKNLAKQINERILSLQNVSAIINDTKEDTDKAKDVRAKASTAKEQANEVLETARNVDKILNETRKMQEVVDEAILKANNDIAATKKDLSQIDSETSEAKNQVKQVKEDVEDINKRVKKLQTGNVKNNVGANQVSTEADKVSMEVKIAGGLVAELSQHFDKIGADLKKRSENSKNSKSKTLRLLEKARQLSANTTGKLSELKEADMLYNEQDKLLMVLEMDIAELNEQIFHYSDKINDKSNYYRNCLN